MAAPPNDIILYHYTFSPFARRITWYLALRGIEYGQCLQPPIMPRPDLSALGVSYRRIPVLAMGRDVYCDTRLMLRKLESRFPTGALGASTPEHKAIEQLLERWTTEGGVFSRASALIPAEMPLLKDPKFTKDREDMTGRAWDRDAVIRGRPEALAHIRDAFEQMESGLLADGRKWILGTEKPQLADIHGVWLFHWLIGMKGALDASMISVEHYPRVYAWVARFDAAIKTATKAMPKPVTLKGADAAKWVLEEATNTDSMTTVDSSDPLRLRRGDSVQVWPTDSGSSGKDSGKLVGLRSDEVVIEGAKGARIHFPRVNFRVRKVAGGENARL